MKFCPNCSAHINRKVAKCPECGYLISKKPKKKIVTVLLMLVVASGLFVVLERPQYLENTPLYDYALTAREKTFAFTDDAKNFVADTVSNHPNLQKTVDTAQTQISKIGEDPPRIQGSIQTIQKAVEDTVPKISPQKTSQELVQYALQRINEDREKNNLKPVLLSLNTAAQIHANDVFENEMISHWMSNGEKPYMTYTKTGGTGYVSQNVAIASCSGFGCSMNPIKQIDEAQYSMMHDDASSNWGHRDNIFQPYHTHVSIGVAYDDNFFVLVQNFEDNYLLSETPIIFTGNNVHIQSNLKSGKIQNIGIFYDPLPSKELYLQHRDDGSYEMGDSIAVVAQPAPLGSYYVQPTDYKLIEAKKWSEKGDSVQIDFDLSPVLVKPGVYTIGVWVEDQGEEFVATSYSVFYK